MSDGIFRNDWDLDVAQEVDRARAKFPNADALFAALAEEVGEVAKALLDEDWSRVRAECVQVAAMAQRLAEEGDPTLTNLRGRRGLDVPIYPYRADQPEPR